MERVTIGADKEKDFPPLNYCNDFTGKAEVWILPLHQRRERVLSIVTPKQDYLSSEQPGSDALSTFSSLASTEGGSGLLQQHQGISNSLHRTGVPRTALSTHWRGQSCNSGLAADYSQERSHRILQKCFCQNHSHLQICRRIISTNRSAF